MSTLTKGMRVTVADGKEGTLLKSVFGDWMVDLGGGQSARFKPEELTVIAEAIELGEDTAIEEATLLAFLGQGVGQSVKDKFPGMHIVRCMKSGSPNEMHAGYWKGRGMSLLSEDPVDSGHDSMVVMGIPMKYKVEFDRQAIEANKTPGDYAQDGITHSHSQAQLTAEEYAKAFGR